MQVINNLWNVGNIQIAITVATLLKMLINFVSFIISYTLLINLQPKKEPRFGTVPFYPSATP